MLKTLERKMYSIPDAAKILDLSVSGLWAMVRAGKIRTVKLGHRRVVPPGVLEDILNGEVPTNDAL